MAASSKETAARLRSAAEAAIESIGLGFDMAVDLRLKYCKKSKLIDVDQEQIRDISIPGGILVRNIPAAINCGKGERLRFASDVLPFQHMSERFNLDAALSGKIPTGQFNSAFEFTGCWQKDAAFTKSLALDGVFITLYTVALDKSHLSLSHHVKQAVPSSWDPPALARFIEKYGTHVVVGVKMGGKDVVYVKQQYTSPLQPVNIQSKLKDVADKRFSATANSTRETRDRSDHGAFMEAGGDKVFSQSEDVTFFCRRRGGSSSKHLSHMDWCQTVQLDPDVVSMSFIPISSLLSGIDGSGFLSHAINLYLRYKPPIEELYQFLEFQLPRQWAPVFGDLAVGPERKQQNGASLQFSLMGPKLHVNTMAVDVGNKPLTGLRLYLEGKKSNCLAIHLQHLSSLPKSFQLQNDSNRKTTVSSVDRRYYEKVEWKSFSHVCSVPVESDDDLSIVTGAEFEVQESGMKNVLFLRLHFSKVTGAMAVKRPEWDGSPVLGQKSGIISSLISTRFSTAQKPPPNPSEVNINSALYPEGPPTSAQTRKLLRYVDTTEVTRGPQDPPGYWVVSGARLLVDNGKISLRAKFSLLAPILPEEDDSFN